MSLFIGSLSFDSAVRMNEVRLGVLAGSAVSAVLGYIVLMTAKIPDNIVAEVAPSTP